MQFHQIEFDIQMPQVSQHKHWISILYQVISGWAWQVQEAVQFGQISGLIEKAGR